MSQRQPTTGKAAQAAAKVTTAAATFAADLHPKCSITAPATKTSRPKNFTAGERSIDRLATKMKIHLCSAVPHAVAGKNQKEKSRSIRLATSNRSPLDSSLNISTEIK